jgi:simple sugar transport system ATP-binding protein
MTPTRTKEIKEAADFCTIIRRGKKIDTVKVADVTQADLASMMVGREVNFKVEKKEKKPGEVILEIKDLVVEDNRGIKAVNGLNLKLRKGEILGIAGIDGNGQSELVESLTGLRTVNSGKILMNDQDITGKTPLQIFEHKISSIPEDRQKHGLVLDFNVAENLVLENHDKPPFALKGILQHEKIKDHANELIEKYPERAFLSHAADPDAERPEKISRIKNFVLEYISADKPSKPYSGGPYIKENIYHIVLNPKQKENFL